MSFFLQLLSCILLPNVEAFVTRQRADDHIVRTLVDDHIVRVSADEQMARDFVEEHIRREFADKRVDQDFEEKRPSEEFMSKQIAEELLQEEIERGLADGDFAETGAVEESVETEAAAVRSCFGSSCQHWMDTDGNRIEAHGAGMLYSEEMGRWYWYGESAKSPMGTNPLAGSVGGAINCYSSDSLTGPWQYEGKVLKQEHIQTSKAPGPYVVERPKVLFNKKTNQYVMWFHADTTDYKFRHVGVATSATPAGPFSFSHVFKPNELGSLDMSLFLDYDGKAYFVRSVDNEYFAISQLTDDFMNAMPVISRGSGENFGHLPCLEGFAMFRHPYESNGTLYMITSGCEYWNPNPLIVLKGKGKSLTNPGWVDLGNPTGQYDSFNSQPNFVVQHRDADGNSYPVYMADNWIHGGDRGLPDASYVWLPLDIKDNGRVVMEKHHAWDPAKPFADDGSYFRSSECRDKVHGSNQKCWVRMPEGCSRPVGESKTPRAWFVVPDEPTWQSCTQRIADFKAWCETTDAEHTFAYSDPEQKCQPRPPTDQACWISLPTGCDRRPQWRDARSQQAFVPCWVNHRGCVEPRKPDFLNNHPPHDWFMGLNPVGGNSDEPSCMMRAMQINEHCNRTDAVYSFGPLPRTSQV